MQDVFFFVVTVGTFATLFALIKATERLRLGANDE
jgi:hypothetical protein